MDASRRFVTAALLAGIAVPGASPLMPGPAVAQDTPSEPFAAFLERMIRRAVSEGVSPATAQSGLRPLAPNPRVIELDDYQPEYTRTFWQYMDNAITDGRVTNAQQRYAQYRGLLDRVTDQYGVPGRYLTAFWGLETNFGGYMGEFDTLQALATLAWHGRRADLFAGELINALWLVDAGWVQRDQLVGSWAGAIGNTQFLPSTYRRYAVDADGDGRRDLFSSLPDVFASSANYLSSIGWDPDYLWGREVRLPAQFPWEMADLSIERPLQTWRDLGVQTISGGPLPVAPIEGSIILPMGHLGPAFVVYQNFRVIMRWNASVPYAVAVGHLADRIGGAPPLQGPRPDVGTPLTREEVRALQTRLTNLGYDPGGVDGRLGPNTRGAFRDWQRSVGVPADGFVSRPLFQRIMGA